MMNDSIHSFSFQSNLIRNIDDLRGRFSHHGIANHNIVSKLSPVWVFTSLSPITIIQVLLLLILESEQHIWFGLIYICT